MSVLEEREQRAVHKGRWAEAGLFLGVGYNILAGLKNREGLNSAGSRAR